MKARRVRRSSSEGSRSKEARHGGKKKKKKAMNPRNSSYAEKKFKKKNLYMPDKTIQSFVSADSKL